MADKITFFPVGNGDMTLISFEDGTNIMIDCNIREKASDDDDEAFDCQKYLMENLPKENDIRYLDAFILTHSDIDHCRNAENYFNLCDPDKVKDDKIFIKELIVAPKLITDDEITNESAKKIKQEANRRKKIIDNQGNSNIDGNRLQIIGYSTELSGYYDITTVAGETIKKLNGKNTNNYEIFVLGPVKKDNDNENAKINDTSIALKITFKKGYKNVIMIAGGDETCDKWVDIINKNPGLTFDVLIAPHHCSWHSISSEDTITGKVNQTVADFLEASKNIAYVIASSKPIKRNDDNPPSYRAKNEYKRHLIEDNRFICLGEYPSEKENKPLILNVSKQGISSDEPGSVQNASLSRSIYTPKTYGQGDLD